jgi:hypothetical protein
MLYIKISLSFGGKMNCKINGCEFSCNDLTDHILTVHGISIKRYRILTNAKNVKDNSFFCDICYNEYDLQEEFKNHCLKCRDVEHSRLIYTEENQDDWVECKVEGCGYRAGKISEHVKLKHDLEKEEYKEKYKSEYISKNYLEKMKAASKKGCSVEKRHYRNKCSSCNTDIFTQKTICEKCEQQKERNDLEEKFKDKIEGLDFVRCKCKLSDGSTCNLPLMKIDKHINKVHGYDAKKYRSEFDSLTCCKKATKNNEK